MTDQNTKLKEYSDGEDLENAVLERVSQQDPTESLDQFISDSSWPWAMRYHLHPDRQNILNWFNFGKNAHVLEFGGGCGAITPFLCQNAASVDVVELSERRSNIIRERCRQYDNLNVYCENIQKFDPKKRYDFATSIGVLEYCSSFFDSETPFADFLSKTYKLLSHSGCLIIAIENKLGIKYWSGSPEDHTNRHFDSIEGYPSIDIAKTFSRQELTELLRENGFKRTEFYYPFPDYKFAYEIFSDRMVPTDNFDINPGLFPSFHPTTREYLFNEYLAMRELIKAGLFADFSNSFLVFAYKQ